jgi:hypothetical protein
LLTVGTTTPDAGLLKSEVPYFSSNRFWSWTKNHKLNFSISVGETTIYPFIKLFEHGT